MWVLGFLTGIALSVFVAAQYVLVRQKRMMRNPTPNFGLPGRIYQGRFERFDEVLAAVFPAAPARSYVLVERKVALRDFLRPAISDASFFLRSAGKRAGQHRFRVEIRLDETRRDAIAGAEAITARFGAVKRIEKSYGGVWFESEALESLDGVRDAARDFSSDIMGLRSTDEVTPGWHLAGRAARF